MKRRLHLRYALRGCWRPPAYCNTSILLRRRLQDHGWSVDHLVGLTYPLANMLLPISNRLVAHSERDRLRLSLAERTMLSGDRHVPGKTGFPRAAECESTTRPIANG